MHACHAVVIAIVLLQWFNDGVGLSESGVVGENSMYMKVSVESTFGPLTSSMGLQTGMFIDDVERKRSHLFKHAMKKGSCRYIVYTYLYQCVCVFFRLQL